jgi:hypothetical protein
MATDIKVKTEETPSPVTSQTDTLATNISVKTEETPTSVTSQIDTMTTDIKVKTEETPSSVTLQSEEAPVARVKGVPTVISETFYYGNKPNVLQLSSSTTSTSSTARPTKRTKLEEEYYLEIRWYKDSEDVENPTGVKEYYYSMFADELPKRAMFSNSHPFTKEYNNNSYRENFEYSLTFCLVDGKGDNRKTLVEIRVYYWKVAITLMHFHILSQDLANFCRNLWVAAGKNEDVYDEMAIEFGESRYSHVEVKTLISKAVGIKRKSDILYVDKVKLLPGATSKDSVKLIEMIFKTCTSASVIAYESDLKGLGVDDKATSIGFKKMRNYCCFIGPDKKF